MASSFIHITFGADLPLGAQLGIDITNDGGSFGTPTTATMIFNWVVLRGGSGQVTKGTPTNNVGERSAMNFLSAFNLETNSYMVSRVGNVVTIEAPNTLSITTFASGGTLANYTNHSSLSITTGNFTPTSFSMTHQFTGSGCENLSLEITTNTIAAKIISPIYQLNGNNPIILDIARGSIVDLRLENEFGYQLQETIKAPDYLEPEKFVFKSFLDVTGFIQLIIINKTYGLAIEYSISSINSGAYFTHNIVSGLETGVSYNMTIRDQFGCKFTKKLYFTENGNLDPYFFISKSNALRFALQGQGNSTDESRLSCQAGVAATYQEIQQFYTSDVIVTQFKSNFADHQIQFRPDTGQVIDITPVKTSNNIGIYDRRTANIFGYDIANGKTALYFTAGEIFDSGNNVIGSYVLDGGLPEWAKVNEVFEYEGGYFLIEQIIFDNDKNALLAIFSLQFPDPNVGIRPVSCIYNRENYEVYEFSLNGSVALNANGSVALNANGSVALNANGSVSPVFYEFLSEKIKCEPEIVPNLLEIRYYNSSNLDIMYSTGIQHLLRIPYISINGKLDENSEVHKTDTNTSLLKADLYEADEIKFAPVTKEIWRKLCQALSHNSVFLNGVGYVKNGSFSTDGPLGQSNLYVLTATMIKTGNIYNE